jgi:cell division protein FtsB
MKESPPVINRRQIHGIYILLAAVIFMGCWIGCSFMHIWYQQKILRIGQEIHAMETEMIQLRRRGTILRAKVAQMQDPSLLQRYALQDRKLIKPAPERFAYVSLQKIRLEKKRVAREIAADGEKNGGGS